MLRSNTLVDDFEYVSRADDAVDTSAEDFEHKWKLYRDGAAEPPLKAGAKPTRFKLRHLTSTERLRLLEMSQGGEHGLYVAAVAFALVGIKDMDAPAGKESEFKQTWEDAGPVRLRHATKETLDAIPVEVLLELGALVMERTTARPS